MGAVREAFQLAWGSLRDQPLRSALAVLGIADCEFWGHPDNHVPSSADLDRAVAQVREELRSKVQGRQACLPLRPRWRFATANPLAVCLAIVRFCHKDSLR